MTIQQSSYRIAIHPTIFERYPQAQVACSLVEVIVKNGRNTKGAEAKYLSNYKQDVAKLIMSRNVTPENYRETPVCQSWKQVYGGFNCSDDKVSTIEKLIGRAVGEQHKLAQKKSADLGKISNFVDLYNCVSLEEMTPMGALDASRIEGTITLRFGHEGETFLGLGRDSKLETVTTDHIVYADDEKVLTWLWNHRDAKSACVPDDSEGKPVHILLFADQAEGFDGDLAVEARPGDAKAAILKAAEKMTKIGGKILSTAYLSAANPDAELFF